MKKIQFCIFFLLIIFSSFSYAQEICANGIDDDADGLVDLNDPDCICNSANLSLIANHSFENNSGCPTTYKQFNLVSNWVSGNNEVIDYMNTCNFNRFNGVSFPDGNGIAGCYYLEDRLRYIGQCLPLPLASGTNYTLNFEVSALSIDNAGNQLDIVVGGLCSFTYNSIPYPVTIALYGSSNCADLPWAGTGSPLGTGSWVLLGQIVYSPTDTLWNDLSINFTPTTNIAAIAIGPPDVQVTQFPIYNEGGNGNIGCFPFIQYDNLILNEANLVADVEIIKSGEFCTGDLGLTGTCNIAGGTWQWYKNGIALTTETNPILQVSSNNYGTGTFTVKYTLGTDCYTEDYLVMLPNGIIPNFSTASSCMENVVAFTDLSFGGANQIIAWDWEFGDGAVSTDEDPVHPYTSNATFNVQLIVTTSEGCKDSIVIPQLVNKPTPLDISTCDCNGLGVSLIPNHSFEDHSCCPTNYSQLNCADTWIQASGATSDYWNTCGTIQMNYNPPLPPPAGDGFAGYIDGGTGYKEYIGACLVEPMLAGQSYNLTFQMAGDNNANFAFWGATNCNDLPFPGQACPQSVGSWEILNQQTITLGGGIWHTVTMNLALTQDIYAILIGPDCGSNGFSYFYVDDLSLSSSILQPIAISGSYCSNDVILQSGAASDSFNLEFQWFKGGIELIGETDSMLYVSANGYGIGDYQVMGIYREGCDISPVFHVDTAYISFDTETLASCPELQNGELLINNVTGIGNTPPYQFHFNNNPPVPDSTFLNLFPGTYTVMVTDSLGCYDSVLVTVDSFPAPQPQFVFDSVCVGSSISFTDQSTISAGTITSWTWDFGDATPVSQVQSPVHTYASDGTWNVTLIVESNQGCTDTNSANVLVYAVPLVNAGADQTICSGSTVTLAGTIGGSASVGSWSGGAGTFNPDSNTLNSVYTPGSSEVIAGTVTLLLTTGDPVGPCNAAKDSMTITINPQAIVYAGIDQTICNGNTIPLAGSIGGGSTIGTWSGGAGSFAPGNTSPAAVYTPTAGEATSGIVSLVFTTDDPAGPCSAVNDAVEILVDQLPTANAGSNQYVCSGSSVTLAGSIGGSATNGTWSGGTGSYSPGNTALNAIYTPSTAEFAADSVVLTLTTNDPAGPCTFSTSNVTIYFYKNPVIIFAADSSAGCPVHCTNFTNSTVVGGGDIVSWDWNFGDGSANATIQTPSHCFTQVGFYDITLTAVSNNGCSSVLTQTQHIQVFSVPVAAFTPSPNPATVLDPVITFNNQSSADVNYWNWNFGDGTTTAPFVQNPVHTYPDEAANYWITLMVHNADGCYDTVAHEIFIEPEFTFFIPNAFSPNGDKINDYFFGSGVGIIEYDLWIFDRWGNMIFNGKELSDKWDGKANGGNDLAQIDVYVWKVTLRDVFNKKHDYIGTVTLVN